MSPQLFNEMSDPSGFARPHYERFDQWLKGVSPETIAAKQTEADLIFRRTGITFSLNGDEGGTEHFFHRSSVRGSVFELLREGQRVDFTPEDSGKGPRAGDVRLLDS